MSIRCGKCEGRHGSVQEVKDCYAGRKVASPAPAASGERIRPNFYDAPCVLCGALVPARTGRVVRRDGGQAGWATLHLNGECGSLAPKVPAPVPAPAREDFSKVPGGYYATVSATGTNDFDFWYVKEGTRNPRVRFVKRVLGGQGPIRIPRETATEALKAILREGVELTGHRFADELGRCWKCGLPLTDEESRARRMGPVCAAK